MINPAKVVSPANQPIDQHDMALLGRAVAELRSAGDVEGHPFHGNQWTGGRGHAGELVSTTLDRTSIRERLQKASGGAAVRIGSRQIELNAANETAAVLDEMKKSGYVMPYGVIVQRAEYIEDVEGFTQQNNDDNDSKIRISIPMTMPDNADLDDAVRVAFGGQLHYPDGTTIDRFAPRNFRDVVVHEMAHVQHFASLGKNEYPKLKSSDTEAARAVSSYATKSADEFVAEAFTKLYRGETLSPASQRLYDRLKGPRIRRQGRAASAIGRLRDVVKGWLAVLGSSSSGNFGHVGRPGEVGGSGPGTGAEQRLSEYTLNPALSASTSNSYDLALNIASLRSAAIGLHFPLEKIVVKDYRRSFVVGERQFNEGGHYDAATHEITFSAQVIAGTTPLGASSMLAHEVTHADWDLVSSSLGLRGGAEVPMDVIDALPSAAVEAVQSAFTDGAAILQREDGITDYSRAYWREVPRMPEPPRLVESGDAVHQWLNDDTGELYATKAEAMRQHNDALERFGESDYDNKFMRAVNETLAEISAIDAARLRDAYPDGKNTNPSPAWRRLHDAVKTTAAALRNTNVITRGSFHG